MAKKSKQTPSTFQIYDHVIDQQGNLGYIDWIAFNSVKNIDEIAVHFYESRSVLQGMNPAQLRKATVPELIGKIMRFASKDNYKAKYEEACKKMGEFFLNHFNLKG